MLRRVTAVAAMVFRVTSFCAGTAAVLALPVLWPSAVLCLAAVAGLLLFGRRPALAALCLGFAWTSYCAVQSLRDDWPCARDREAVEVTGRVATPAIERTGRTDFDLDVPANPAGSGRPARLRVSWYEPGASPLPGQHWRMTLRLRCRSGMANPGAQDRELDLLRQGIAATAYVVAASPPERLDDGGGHTIVERLRARIASGIDELLPDSASGAVLQGLSVGVRGNIPEPLWDAFAATGVAHLMAISGMHVTGCAVFVLLLMRAAWRLPGMTRIPLRTGIEAVTVFVVTAAYAWLSGSSLPALRTLVMVAIVVWLRVLRRALPIPQVLAVAALVLVAMDPLSLTSAGFWLSFAATAALLSLMDCDRDWRSRIAAFARAQLAILALLTPVLAGAFGRVSLIAPFVNAAAIPLFSLLLLPAVLLGTSLELLAPGSGAGVWRILAAGLDSVWPGLLNLAGWEIADWAPAAQPMLLMAGSALVTLSALCLPLRGLQLATAALLLAVVGGARPEPAAGGWNLHVLDVGQGLAAVVETRRHVLVFDTGPGWRGGGAAARVSVLPFLRARGIRQIDQLVVSHQDLDHSGGARTLVDALSVASMMSGPGEELPSVARVCRRGDRWRWDDVEFEVVHPAPGASGGDNDRSCALRVSGTGGAALLLADPESAAEAELQRMSVAADVVLLPHHGSRTSSSPGLVAAVSPRIGIASAGFGNRWGMPAPEVVARWRAAGTTVLTTADAGAVSIRFTARPEGLAVETERSRNRRWWRRVVAG
ncbi:MAG TPA: DNA internalization-related competence protein ComEC/Rec2 [Steroidobacteraceae bacterium]|nr:DNA internalization-related competence protein ComEC/Rec2 [Steroidobacteraceae bacterium]